MKSFDCALGKIMRYIICASVDASDAFVYCGTRSGDVLEVSLSKGIFSRSGPMNKKFSGAVNEVLVKGSMIYTACSDGTFARIDKSSLTVAATGEIKMPHSSCMSLASSKAKVYCITNRGDMMSVADDDTVRETANFMSSPFDMVSGLKFPANYCGVFASCSQDEIRLWSPDN